MPNTQPSKLDEILDRLQDYLPDSMYGLNHNDLPETKQALKSLMLDLVSETDFAYKDASAYAEVLKQKINAL